MGKLAGKIEEVCLSDWRMCKAKGMVLPARKNSMNPTKQEKNKALVLEAFDTLFNKRDLMSISTTGFSASLSPKFLA